MTAPGGRARRAIAAVAAAVAVAGAACSGTAEPPAAEPSTPAPTASPEPPPEELVERAYQSFLRSARRRDARSAEVAMTRAAVRYLNQLRNVTSHAGPAVIARLSPFERMVVAALRTDPGPHLTEGVSTAAFLDFIFEYDMAAIPPRELDARPTSISVDGRRATVVVGRSLEISLELEDGYWRVDGRDFLELGNQVLRQRAERRGVGIEQAILLSAQAKVGEPIAPDVWDKP